MNSEEVSTPKEMASLGHSLTELVLEVFRLNGDLVATGDALVRDLKLTSARWQVLGAIKRSLVPLPVAHLARNMGYTRQAVQRVVDDLRAADMVCLQPNPHHRRAVLVIMTDGGLVAYLQAAERQRHWVDELATNLSLGEIGSALKLLQTLRQRLSPSDE